jgi:hypothetical protein
MLQGFKGEINPEETGPSPRLPLLKDFAFMTRFATIIPANGGMSRNTTKKSKMSDYPAIGLGYTGISRGCP